MRGERVLVMPALLFFLMPKAMFFPDLQIYFPLYYINPLVFFLCPGVPGTQVGSECEFLPPFGHPLLWQFIRFQRAQFHTLCKSSGAERKMNKSPL